MILVDDLKPTIRSFGDEVAITPHMDRLAASGVRFEKAYCNQAVCMASRYNLMLGSRSTSTGFYAFGTEFREVYPDAVTLPQHFINHGYVAHSIGKVFHIGHGNTNDDASWSVPHHADKVIDYVLPESNHRELTREEGLFTNQRARDENGDLRPRGMAWEAADVLDEAYADGRVASTAIDRLQWLQRNEEKPFFLAVGFVRPHLPFSAPKKYWDMYDRNQLPMPDNEEAPIDAPGFAVKRKGEITAFRPVPSGVSGKFDRDLTQQLIHGYYASVTYMDAQLGKVLDALEETGQADNTIVILWGDHGYHLGDLGSWTKHSNYEQANHIPIIIRAPGQAVEGAAARQIAETVDIYPTLAALAGLPTPRGPQPIDGTDLTTVLKKPEQVLRPYAYHAYPRRNPERIGRAFRTDRYRLVEWIPRDDSHEIVYELYDYSESSVESRNIASSSPDIVAEIQAMVAHEPTAKWQVGR
ncbi:MAG: sulfatase [Synoicihabitans sp.]